MYEYPSTPKLRDVRKLSGDKHVTLVMPSAAMMAYDISCGNTSLSTLGFMHSIYSYRFAQLSTTTHPTCIESDCALNMTTHHINASDVVRAVLAAKLNEDTVCPGITYEYTQCGVFEPITIVPLLVIVLFLVSLAVYFTLKPVTKSASEISFSSDDEEVRAPITATEWSRFAMGSWSNGKTFMRAGSPDHKAHIEMVGDRNCIGEYLVVEEEETGNKRLQMNEIVVIANPAEDENKGLLKRMATNALKRATNARRFTATLAPFQARTEGEPTSRPGRGRERISCYKNIRVDVLKNDY